MSNFGNAARCGQYINQFILAERAGDFAKMQQISSTVAALGLSCPNIPAPAPGTAVSLPGSGTITLSRNHLIIGGAVIIFIVMVLLLK